MKPRLCWNARVKRWQCAALTEAIRRFGGQQALASAIGVRQSAIRNWLDRGQCPSRRVLDIEHLTGVSRHKLRPDLFRAEWETPRLLVRFRRLPPPFPHQTTGEAA